MTYSIFITTSDDACHYPHFTGEQTEALKGLVTLPKSSRAVTTSQTLYALSSVPSRTTQMSSSLPRFISSDIYGLRVSVTPENPIELIKSENTHLSLVKVKLLFGRQLNLAKLS